MKPIRACFTILRRRGPGYFWYLLSGWLLPRLLFRWRDRFPGKLARRLGSRVSRSALRERARALTPADPDAVKFTSWARFPVDPTVRVAVETARGNSRHEAFPVGRIDDDGRLLGLFGELPGFPLVSPEGFVERKRFELAVVIWDDAMLIRKDYRGDTETFIREWAALAILAGRVNVPAVYHVDESRTTLYKNLVWGRTIREILVENGAKILHEHTRKDSQLDRMADEVRIKEVWRRGREVLSKALSEKLVTQMAEQLERTHVEGVNGISFTWGNVVIDERTKTPWFIDLDKARVMKARTSAAMQLLRDQEREQFNELYGPGLLTEAVARAALAEQSRKTGGWYAPIDFGGGLSVGGFWTNDNGSGRWECINGPVLHHLLPSQRVLDLGSNNGIMPMLMLRAGAKEVLGVELSPDNADCAHLVRRIFEWRDGRRYDLRMHVGNMLDVLSCDWGRFDLVTAFCSLYYLEPTDMAAVVRRAAQLAPLMVIQAKTDTRAEAKENKAEKSSLPFLHRLLAENGFPEIETHAPAGFSRPILIGRKLRPGGLGKVSRLGGSKGSSSADQGRSFLTFRAFSVSAAPTTKPRRMGTLKKPFRLALAQVLCRRLPPFGRPAGTRHGLFVRHGQG